MPSSTVSLESLSSPSPSPPPPDPEEQHEKRAGVGLDSGSELSELTEDEQENDGAIDDELPRSSTRKKKQQRASVVPPDMWDWAKKKSEKNKADWYEEEEEEEQAGPVEAMEEEEEDDHAQHKDSGSDRDLTPDMNENGYGDGVSDNEVDENEHEPPEDEGESGDEIASPAAIVNPNGEFSGDEGEVAEDAEPEPDTLDGPQSSKAIALSLTDEEDGVDDEDAQDTGEVTKEGSELDEEGLPPGDVDADADIPVEDEPQTTEAVTPIGGLADAMDADLSTTMNIDVALPQSPVAGSIMAGTGHLGPPSPSSSQPSTPSASRLSSRYPSVEPEREQDVPSEPEAEPEPERKPSGRAARNKRTKPRTRAARRPRAAAPVEVGDGDPDADHAEPHEGEGVDGDDPEVPTPDLDLDADMQPAHRAEALDELSRIELKFALLRERLYVEKMDSLAWEEGLIADGTHPELLHLHAELSSRRDKRLELAARRRDYEIANVTKRRRLDETGAWSTWSNARDELQTEMIAETNGKKRKLERERRTLDRPPLPRRFPLPFQDVPSAPSLNEIVRSSPFGLPESASALAKRASRKKESTYQVNLAHPTLAPLSSNEILHDLDHFYSHRHVTVGFDPHRSTVVMNPALGSVSQGMDQYPMGMHMIDGPNRFGPQLQQHLLQQPSTFPPPPRLSHQHSAPPGFPHISPHHQLQIEQDMQMRQHPGTQHPHMHQLMRRSMSPVPINGAGYAGVPTTIGGGPVPPAFSNPKVNGWPAGRESKRVNGDVEGRERERMSDVLSQREKERDRAERDRERERDAERAFHPPHSQPRHPGHQHAHQHAHSNTQGQAVHHHPPHNHQHHHHHVHHHHHHVPPQQGFGPATGHPPPMMGLPPGPVGGPSQTLSPSRGGREFGQRRPRSGAPADMNELSAPVPKLSATSPPIPVFWKSDTQSGQHPPDDREHDGDRAPPGPLGSPNPDVHDHLLTPFTMGPSQIQRDPFSIGSPRKTHAPAGASDTKSGSLTRQAHQASVHSSYPSGSPPNDNGRPVHPSSPPAFPGSLHLPIRPSQPGRMPLGGPRSPPVESPRRISSPKSRHVHGPSPGITMVLPKLGGFPLPEDGRMAKIASVSEPQPLLHPSSASAEVISALPSLPQLRTPSGVHVTDNVMGLQAKAVSVDGP